jgi:hypothetical protein
VGRIHVLSWGGLGRPLAGFFDHGCMKQGGRHFCKVPAPNWLTANNSRQWLVGAGPDSNRGYGGLFH